MKRRYVGDIVFLIDVTSDMQEIIDAIRYNIKDFFGLLFQDIEDWDRHGTLDWRARVIGYRDVEADGADWFVSNPFVRDVEAIESQLDALDARGGGDMPESLLDALYKVATFGNTERGSQEGNPEMWRHRSEARRCVVVFTDAPFHSTTKIPEAPGLKWTDIGNLVVQERLCLFLFAPQMDCYDDLSQIPRCEYMAFPSDFALGCDATRKFASVVSDAAFYRQLAHCLSRLIVDPDIWEPEMDSDPDILRMDLDG